MVLTEDLLDHPYGAFISSHFAGGREIMVRHALVAYGRGERQVEKIQQVSDRHRVATMRTLRLAFLSSAALELLASISVAIVAVWCGIRLAEGHMPLAPALLAILLAPEAYWPIRRVGQEFHSAADGAEAVNDVTTALTEQPSAGPASGGGRGHVVVRGISYTYPGAATPVIQGFDLHAEPGLTVITGPSGAGKSTLLELLAGQRTPSAGSVRGGAAHLVSQRPFVAAAPVRDNLRLGNTAEDPDLWEVLRRVGLDGAVASMPHSLDTMLGDDGFGLSAGQRARLVLARALLSPAPVLLLDEPTAHLDAGSSPLVHDLIAELAAQRTVVVVTHRPELLTLADRHVALEPVGVTA